MSEAFASVGELLERLAAPERATRRAACEEAVARLPGEPALRDAVHRLLLDGEPTARFAAAFVSFHAERPTLRLLPALLGALELEDGDARWSAVQMLTDLGRLQPEVLPVLLHEARSAAHVRRRRMGIYALRELAAEHGDTEVVFLAALEDDDAEVRRAALSSIGKLAEPGRNCLERVVAIAREDRDPRMRRIASVLLPELTQHHPEAQPGVRALLGDLATGTDPMLARVAVAARARLESPAS